jgi:hypothetical protein
MTEHWANHLKWKVVEDTLIGGWAVIVEDEVRSLNDGAKVLVWGVEEPVANKIVQTHNNRVDSLPDFPSSKESEDCGG